MKPKNLAPPFSWEDRQVLLGDSVLFVPDYLSDYEDYDFPGWESPQVFGNDNPVFVEFCSGNGAWIAQQAQNNPDKNWVAVEKRFDRVRKIWSKAKNLELSNLFTVCGDARLFVNYYIEDGSVTGVFVNFPDPWPKERHAKHRLIQSEFVKECARIIKPGGFIMLVTDDKPYSQQMLEVLVGNDDFRPCYPDPYYITDLEDYGSSFFNELWQTKGRTIHYIKFERR
ncbi:MAG: tRNA (guanosine(46)-N7)-methyltransferase TrmB [Chlamydiota bacterium]